MWFVVFLIAPCLALHTREPPAPEPMTRNNPVEGWVQVRLNHFMAYDMRTFPMRYYYNAQFAEENIVIVVGGEWSISPGWTTGGLPFEMAQEMRAGLFYTEHRYYGNTRPFSDSNLSDLRFLTIDQALADLVQFIHFIKSDAFEDGRYKNGKVALVGCSYAGTMVTWMRLAYPHVVDAAFSDSGPLQPQEDFPEYLEVITEAISAQGGAACLTSIEQAMTQLVALLATETGPAQVSEMFNTCSPIQAGTPLDLATFFFFGITESFASLVQYATPGNIPAACQVLNNSTVSSPVQRLANWITAQQWTQPCIETRYTQVVANHRNTSFASPDATMRLWTYQTCVEFGWYQTTTSSRQPFLSTVPLEYFHQMCKDFFSNDFDEERLRAGIDRTKIFFSGLSHLPDRVVSVAGTHDPWSPMGPNVTHAHHNAPVYVVPRISHCRAMRSSASSETEELAAVKIAVKRHMLDYIVGPTVDSGASTSTVTVVLFVTALLATLL